MTSEQIQLFISAARSLNFTETAEEFHTTQPTVSRQIHRLEEEWGVQLFSRVRKKMFLTPEGAVMLRMSQLAAQILENGLKEADSLKEGYRGSIKIGFLDSIDESIMIALTEQFEREHPEILMKVEKGSFGQLRDSLDHGTADIIFTLDFEENQVENVVSEVFRREKAVFVISDRHSLYYKTDLSYRDFTDMNFVFPNSTDSPGREEDMLQFFRGLKLKGNHIMLVNNLSTVLFYVHAGKAAALLDTSVAEIHEDNYRTVELPEEMIPGVDIVALWKKDNLNPCIPMLYNSRLFNREL